MHNYEGYKLKTQFSRLSEVTAMIKAAILYIPAILLISYILKIEFIQSLNLISVLIFSFSIIFLPSLLRVLLNKIIPTSIKIDNTVIIGVGEMGKSFLNLHSLVNVRKFNIIGTVDDNIKKGTKFLNYKILGGIKNLSEIFSLNKTNRAIVAIRNIDEEKINFIRKICSEHNVELNFLPSIESFKNDLGKLNEHSGVPLISKQYKNISFFYRISKRILDIAIVMIIFFASLPFWILIPILIKYDSKGPILFKQKRIGLNGKPFKLYKFRSMHSDSPKYAHCPDSSSDPRITKIGKWLRKTSIDELPQIYNVLKGEMSMVGPRPEMPFIVKSYNRIEKRRLVVKPGLTGLWQVSPHRNTEINHNLEYDFYYIENQSFILDLVILFMTAIFAVRGITH